MHERHRTFERRTTPPQKAMRMLLLWMEAGLGIPHQYKDLLERDLFR